MTVDRSTGLSLGLAVILAAWIAYGFMWAGTIEQKVAENERQNRAQWQRIGDINNIAREQARIAERVDTILDILKSDREP